VPWLRLGVNFDPLTADLSSQFYSRQALHGRQRETLNSCRTIGDVIEVLEQHAADLVEQLTQNHSPTLLPT